MFNNMTLIDAEWSDSYHNIAKVDYTKFRTGQPDFELTPEQQLLFTKLQVYLYFILEN